eukprot:4068782-Pleurochrysis_carterae.AAC.1
MRYSAVHSDDKREGGIPALNNYESFPSHVSFAHSARRRQQTEKDYRELAGKWRGVGVSANEVVNAPTNGV